VPQTDSVYSRYAEETTAHTSGLSEEVHYRTRVTSLGESCRVSLDVDGILGEWFQVIKHNSHVRVIANVHCYVNRLPTVPNNNCELLMAYVVRMHNWHWHQRAGEKEEMPLLSAVVDEGRMRPGHWLGPVLCFLQFFDTDGWVTGRTSGSQKNLLHLCLQCFDALGWAAARASGL